MLLWGAGGGVGSPLQNRTDPCTWPASGDAACPVRGKCWPVSRCKLRSFSLSQFQGRFAQVDTWRGQALGRSNTRGCDRAHCSPQDKCSPRRHTDARASAKARRHTRGRGLRVIRARAGGHKGPPGRTLRSTSKHGGAGGASKVCSSGGLCRPPRKGRKYQAESGRAFPALGMALTRSQSPACQEQGHRKCHCPGKSSPSCFPLPWAFSLSCGGSSTKGALCGPSSELS